jgi:hypothetical protein
VQPVTARADPPVDAAHPVTGAELADVQQVRPVARAPGPVAADHPRRPGRKWAGLDRVDAGQHPSARLGAAHRTDEEEPVGRCRQQVRAGEHGASPPKPLDTGGQLAAGSGPGGPDADEPAVRRVLAVRHPHGEQLRVARVGQLHPDPDRTSLLGQRRGHRARDRDQPGPRRGEGEQQAGGQWRSEHDQVRPTERQPAPDEQGREHHGPAQRR